MKGILPIGIKYLGEIHREVEMRARKVRDSIEASADPEVAGDDSLLGLAILSRQIVSLGTIPADAIDWKLLYDAWEEDVQVMDSLAKEAATRLRTFPGGGQRDSDGHAGAHEDRVHGDGGKGHAGGGSAGMAGSLREHHEGVQRREDLQDQAERREE